MNTGNDTKFPKFDELLTALKHSAVRMHNNIGLPSTTGAKINAQK